MTRDVDLPCRPIPRVCAGYSRHGAPLTVVYFGKHIDLCTCVHIDRSQEGHANSRLDTPPEPQSEHGYDPERPINRSINHSFCHDRWRFQPGQVALEENQHGDTLFHFGASARPIPQTGGEDHIAKIPKNQGEASNPGPTAFVMRWAKANGFWAQDIQGYGQCLYRALATHLDLEVQTLRNTLISQIENIRHVLDVMDPTGRTLREALAELHDPKVWGSAVHIALAAESWKITIWVHSFNQPTHKFGSGQKIIHILWHNEVNPNGNPNHYDVLHICDVDQSTPSQREVVL